MTPQISKGFSKAEHSRVAALYWEAFSTKLNIAMGPRDKALRFIVAHLNPEFGLVARGADGTILGLAGFKTSKGALIGGGVWDLLRVYGVSALYRLPLLAMVERDIENDVLLMDGICVDANARGLGVGSALLQAIKEEATARDLGAVRLDVIDTNPRARALYERRGFKATKTTAIGPFSRIFGFQQSTSMQCDLAAPDRHPGS